MTKTRKLIWNVLIILAAAMMMTACGIGSEEVLSDAPPVTMEPEPTQEPPEEELPEPPAEPELVYGTGRLTEAEEALILNNMKTLRQNLELEEYIGEGIHMVSDEEWFDSMAPRLYEGIRSYVLQKEEEVLLTFQVGYDASGEAFIHVFCPMSDGRIVVLRQDGSVTWLLRTAVTEDGLYEGSFERWLIDSAKGEIRLEEGTYAAGIVVGDYSVSVCSVDPGDAFDLWTNREGFAYETTTVEYDQQGELVPTPTPEPTPTPTRRPTAPVKTPEPTPEPTPKPTQAPAPQPEPEPESTPAPTPEPEPTPTPAPEQSSGDTDIEWSDDIL